VGRRRRRELVAGGRLALAVVLGAGDPQERGGHLGQQLVIVERAFRAIERQPVLRGDVERIDAGGRKLLVCATFVYYAA
jgi:hypothetical protein